jgi:acylphosphatase
VPGEHAATGVADERARRLCYPAAVGDVALRIVVEGRVQGVFFRAFTRQLAGELGVRGWVRNRNDGNVEVVAAGAADVLDRFKERLREGPPAAHVEALYETALDEAPSAAEFEIRH